MGRPSERPTARALVWESATAWALGWVEASDEASDDASAQESGAASLAWPSGCLQSRWDTASAAASVRALVRASY